MDSDTQPPDQEIIQTILNKLIYLSVGRINYYDKLEIAHGIFNSLVKKYSINYRC
jgi:hypothetical protein